MGGSRRRLKKGKPKVQVGLGPLKRKKNEKTRVPLELAEKRPQLEKRLQTSAEWSKEATLNSNYQANKLVLNPNESFGRNQASLPLKSKEERQAAQEEDYDDDDELRAGCNLERKSGKAPPPRLTSTQKAVVEALLAAHGDNLDAMVLDTKLNKMQHSAGQLRKLIEGYRHWQGPAEKVRHDFHGPKKPFKRVMNSTLMLMK